MCLRHNYGLWKDWKQFNQNVRIICEPSSELQKQTIRNSPSGKVNMQRVKLCSVKIKVSTNMNSPKRQATPEIYHHLRLTESNIKRSLEDPTSYRKNLSLVEEGNEPTIGHSPRSQCHYSSYKDRHVPRGHSNFYEPNRSRYQVNDCDPIRCEHVDPTCRNCSRNTYV